MIAVAPIPRAEHLYGGRLSAPSSRAELDRLLGDVARRDNAAFRSLYDAAAPKLFAVILRIVKSRPVAEEVLQDTFLRIWQNAESYSSSMASAQTWMNSIARNRSIDVLRQRGAVPRSEDFDDVEWFEKVADHRDREGEMVGTASLRQCLSMIEDQARTCVLLAYYEGYSREELAQRYDRPVNTIKTWLHRSLLALRACLDGEAT